MKQLGSNRPFTEISTGPFKDHASHADEQQHMVSRPCQSLYRALLCWEAMDPLPRGEGQGVLSEQMIQQLQKHLSRLKAPDQLEPPEP